VGSTVCAQWRWGQIKRLLQMAWLTWPTTGHLELSGVLSRCFQWYELNHSTIRTPGPGLSSGQNLDFFFPFRLSKRITRGVEANSHSSTEKDVSESRAPVAHTCKSYLLGRQRSGRSVRSQPREIVCEMLSGKNPSQKRAWWSGSRCRPCVQTPVPKKKKNCHGKTTSRACGQGDLSTQSWRRGNGDSVTCQAGTRGARESRTGRKALRAVRISLVCFFSVKGFNQWPPLLQMVVLLTRFLCALHGLLNARKVAIKNKGVLSSADKMPLDALLLELIT
jgi:hypothetical protein